MENTKIENFYRLWTEGLDNFLSAYIYDENNNLLPTRHIFSHYEVLLEKFLNNQTDELEKINLLSGIRGVGKTTLFAQIFYAQKFAGNQKIFTQEYEKIYLDVSELHLEGITLNEFFRFYEDLKRFKFENLNKKILILLDEVHYDEQWGLFLKTIFDRTMGHRNVLILATGSSALCLNMNPDLSRRASTEEIYPLKFTEYLKLKNIKFPVPDLSDTLLRCLLESENARQMYESVMSISLEVNRLFANLPPKIEYDFLDIGGFPFVIKTTNKERCYKLIQNVIEKLITKDIITLKKFNSETIQKIYNLLYLLAKSDVISYEKLGKSLNIDNKTLTSLLDVLVMAGIIIKIRSYGGAYAKARKPVKYLFISPSLRSSLLQGRYPPEIKGKILEDYCGLVFIKDFKKLCRRMEFMYDSSEKGADFILRNDDKELVIEIGFNKEDYGIKQIKETSKKIKNFSYGISIGNDELELIDDKFIKLPLRYLLLI
ncbi:MAG: hypothetical protein CVT88_01035 [Candidatus Altiarchaeales archaeon HGW-Altiarchaeales-1]|nr:MAG: hypothetical protein CVT88_01035 [Candidatus Altiarchaeales archaeon HGW-Altiarchaeales-1]